ncbi:MAG: hypothetical protein ACREBG_30955 [Pyrinomonadaceae bacterium]
MIRNLAKGFLALCLLTVGGGVAANAQIGSVVTIRGNVPFAFMVGNTTLPAGKYEIRGLNDNNPNVLEVRSVNGRTTVFADTENVEAKGDRIANKSELIFDKVGDKYFLSQIWPAGSAFGSELMKSRTEKNLEDGGMRSERHSVVGILKHLRHHKRSS